jgi:hypothetical protein
MLRDRVLVLGMLLDAAVARYLGITSQLLLDVDSINGSVDVGVSDGVGGCRSSVLFFYGMMRFFVAFRFEGGLAAALGFDVFLEP